MRRTTRAHTPSHSDDLDLHLDLERAFKVITITLSLRIYITDDADFGAYRCVASNALGQDDGLTYLDGVYCTV